MCRVILIMVWACLAAATAEADPTDLEGGVFIAHYPAAMQFSSDPPAEGWCEYYEENFALTSCEDQVNRIDTSGGVIWFVLAAWTEAKEFCGVSFGLSAFPQGAFGFTDVGPCFPANGLEIPTAEWPGPEEGTSIVVTDTPWEGEFVPVYYFSGYAYSAGVISLAPNPQTGSGGTANCSNPPETWPAVAFGAMGLFQNGGYACPTGGHTPGGNEPAVCCVDSDCYQVTEVQCTALGGQFHASEPFCYLNVCEPFVGRACCLGDGTCAVLTVSECTVLGGTWISDRQSCEPTPCDEGTETTWGVIKVVTE